MRGKAIGKRISHANPEIAQALLERDITTTELAERTGRDRSTIWRWLADPELDPARRALIWKAIEK